jgi:hypothetical protein
MTRDDQQPGLKAEYLSSATSTTLSVDNVVQRLLLGTKSESSIYMSLINFV